MPDGSPPQLTKDDLEELLQCKVDSFTISMLTAPGDNYGSTMLLVNAILLPDRREISIAAKMVPASLFMRGMFQVHETVRKEIYMYVRVRPEYHAIQEEYGVPEEMFLDVIPKCYGARTTRGGDIDQPVDETSAILMENLKVSGYRLADRIVGMDLKHAEYVVTRLARFHATAIVIKLKKPTIFKDTVLKATTDIGAPPFVVDDSSKQLTTMLDNLLNVPAVAKYMDKIKTTMEKGMDKMRRKGEHSEVREPFATIVHADFWTNNMMFSYADNDGTNINGFKIVDYQCTCYGSPAADLLFFLYSSTTLEFTKEDCDRAIKLYHNEFIKWLELFGCDTGPFRYEMFLEEVNSVVEVAFCQIFFMLKVLCLPESNAPELSKSGMGSVFYGTNGLGEIYFKKVDKFVREFVERNWI